MIIELRYFAHAGFVNGPKWLAAVSNGLGDRTHDATLSLAMVEVLLWRLEKLPFTCSYVPGRVPVVALLASYWMAFMLYTHLMAYVEYEMLHSRLATAICLGCLLSAWRGVAAYRQRAHGESAGFLFHQEPEPVVCTLNLGY